ncbi:SipW-dependent-type signal peptide-containing protein [Halosimplex amylolyticum]|uniref:SipW-dependent-type signal peptide-containing protein n=1 Tax=Halosimplex amylolyticum TaxID=3396616 RepID=UPI003F556ED0
MTDGNDTNDDGLRFTRRSLLAGLGTVGVASVGAGLGTTALFSDEELFEDNELRAGALNMRVTVDNVAHSTPIVRDNTTITPSDTADGQEVTISVADLKPGDWLILEWNPEVIANPGYVRITSVDEDYSNVEGGTPESESETASPGDLGDAILSTVWQSWDNLNSSRQYLGGLDATTDLNDSGLSGYETPDMDGVTGGGAHYTTLNEAHSVYESGVLLRDASTGEPLVIGANSDAAWFYQLLELPREVGNEIQGDEVTFTLRFDAEQVRNNPTPFDGA